MAQVSELSVGMLQLALNLLFHLLIATEHLVLLVTFVPLSGSANGLQSLVIVCKLSYLVVCVNSLHNIIAWLELWIHLWFSRELHF